MLDRDYEKIQQFLDKSVEEKVFPGVNAGIIAGDETVLFSAGNRAVFPSVEKNDPGTLYDLASLTKVMITVPLIFQLIDKNIISLSSEVSAIFPDFPFHKITVLHLLTHTSGLPANIPMMRPCSRKEVYQMICSLNLEGKPGEKVIYSDVGYILLGFIAEKLTSMLLDELAVQKLFLPMHLKNALFCPPEKRFLECAPEEISIYDGKLIRGRVHDHKASLMGGVSGHAGAFMDIRDLCTMLSMYLHGGSFENQVILKKEDIELFSTRFTPDGEVPRSTGFILKNDDGPFSDKNSGKAYFHTGFTGTSVLIDPELDFAVAVLSNRVHPSRDNMKIFEFRKNFHKFVFNTLF